MFEPISTLSNLYFVNFSSKGGKIMTRYDSIEARLVILSIVKTELNIA